MPLAWLTAAAVLLSACAAGSSGSSRNLALTDEEKLALGTMKLEAAGHPVDPAEAARLLPLWQLLRQLHSSSSAAPEEIAAVVEQIRSTMTPVQVAAIDGMQMSRADALSAFQQSQAGSSTAARTGASRSGSPTNGNQRNGGNGPAFFFGGGPGEAGFGGEIRSSTNGSSGTQQTPSSTQRSQALANALINQVIALLQDKPSG